MADDKDKEKDERKSEDKRLHKKIGRRLTRPAPAADLRPQTWSNRKEWR